jgi:hypothetical protein
LEGIFPYLPEYTDRQKQSVLLHGLRLSLQQVILSQPSVNYSYEGLQRFAERLEMQASLARTVGSETFDHRHERPIDSKRRRRETSPHHTPASGVNQTPVGMESRDSKKRRRGGGPPSRSKRPVDVSQVTCWSCNEKGHYADRCPKEANGPKNGEP